jgi:hypothetical protein
VVGKPYLSFVRSLCGALSRGDSKAVSGSLMYYQYNSGLRWGMLGDGEGHTADPGLLRTWLARARPHCVSFSPGHAGHGNLLTSGWREPAPWGIVEMDMLHGHWKINDFTFGSGTALARAMQVERPILPYHG